MTDTEKQLAAAVAENVRLREALGRMGDYDTLNGDKYNNYEDGWHGVARFARAALAETPAVESFEAWRVAHPYSVDIYHKETLADHRHKESGGTKVRLLCIPVRS